MINLLLVIYFFKSFIYLFLPNNKSLHIKPKTYSPVKQNVGAKRQTTPLYTQG